MALPENAPHRTKATIMRKEILKNSAIQQKVVIHLTNRKC